jgi:hypothetical protein
MSRSRSVRSGAVIVVAFAVLAFLGWQAASQAQPGGSSPMKLAGNAKETKGGFEGLLSTHGAKTMLLAVQVRVAGPKVDSVEHLGKLVQSTDSFLVIKLQNQQDLVFIPWEHVLWITARPSV